MQIWLICWLTMFWFTVEDSFNVLFTKLFFLKIWFPHETKFYRSHPSLQLHSLNVCYLYTTVCSFYQLDLKLSCNPYAVHFCFVTFDRFVKHVLELKVLLISKLASKVCLNWANLWKESNRIRKNLNNMTLKKCIWIVNKTRST